MIAQHIRRMCVRLFGRPVADNERLPEEQRVIMKGIRDVRTGAQGRHQMETRGTVAREFAGFQHMLGARSSALPPGPSSRREGGVGPADHGRWWQQSGAPTERPTGVGRGGKPASNL